jgi:lysyl-tRNA synthetase, class II
LIGVFIPPVALVAAVRLATPSSPWAKWRYHEGSHKLARSQARFARAQARRVRLLDAIGGAPEASAPPDP